MYMLHGFEKEKSECLDGWTNEFYSGFHRILEEYILRVIKESMI